jgi:hypothetical protein
MDHLLFFSFARQSNLSNPIILVQILTEFTVSCSVSLMSCWAIHIMRRPSWNLLSSAIFDSNILDTVGSKMALLASNNPLEASTNPVEGKSILAKAMGAPEPVKKVALGR